MELKSNRRDPLGELDIFDPDTGSMVRRSLGANRANASPEALSVLADETIWALGQEVSFGQAVAQGILSIIQQSPTCLQTYRARVRTAGAKGPTLGRLMAIHLVPVLTADHTRIRHLFSKAFEVMEKAGAYTLTKPLEALDRILHGGDHRSAETYLSLLCTAFSREMPYSRRQQLAALLPKAAFQYAPAKRPWQFSQLERVMRVDDRLALALMTGMDKGLDLLSALALSRFVSQGLERCEPDRQRAEKFFALESRSGRSVFEELQVAASFCQVQPQLNRYLQARTGRKLTVRQVSALPMRGGDTPFDSGGTFSDRKHIYLPNEVERFETKTDNVRVYKCLARFEAGLHEFGTFRFDLERALELCRENQQCFLLPDPAQSGIQPSVAVSDLERFFNLFPEPLLAEDLFLIFEHGRIRHLLEQSYPGLVSTCLPMFQQEARMLLSKGLNRQALIPIYARIACGLSPEDSERELSGQSRLVRKTAELFDTAMQRRVPTAETSGDLVAASYAVVNTQLDPCRRAAGSRSYQPLQTPFLRRIRPDLHQISGLRIERLARSIKMQLADRGFHIYASVLRDQLESRRGELRTRDIEEILRDPKNYTNKARTARQPICGDRLEVASQEVASITDTESELPADQHGNCPAFWYQEWDCRLGDYLSDHARVLECAVEGHASRFYESTLVRYAGLVQQIRSVFELLKPQGLKWYRRWIEGDEFDYHQLLDFALDRRAGRTPSERLYIKRLKALRDVAVLLLVDLSRSTANAVAGSDTSVLDVEKEAIVLFSEALKVVGDRFAIAGFSGAGRLGVEYFQIKDFSDPLDDDVRCRINAMAPRRNTRMGAAIRHAASRLSAETCRVKLLIMLGDGFPNDLNYKKTYAVEDTRRAIAELRAQGVHVHAITVNMNPANASHLDELFGDIHHNLITDVTDLPDRLWRIYGALTR